MTTSKMNLYEKIIVPVAVAGIIGGFGMGLAALRTNQETAIILKEVVKTQEEMKEMVYNHDKDLAILKDRQTRE